MAQSHTYVEGDQLYQMRRNAEERMRQMQRRSQSPEDNFFPHFARSDWRPDPNTRQEPEETPAPGGPRPGSEEPARSAEAEPSPQAPPEPPPASSASPSSSPLKEGEGAISTLLQDVVKAIGLDEDRLIIIGLLLILINEKADDTLILALCYLLL